MTRVGLAYWSNKAFLSFTLNQYGKRQDIIQAIYNIPFLGDKTNTTSALIMARHILFNSKNGDRFGIPNIVIMLTDGQSNIIPQQTIPQAISGKNEGIRYIVVAIGTSKGSMELQGIASVPMSTNLFPVRSETNLPAILDDVIGTTCNG